MRWIPLLLVYGFWHHVMRRYPASYETRMWAIVFPLGMMSAASISFGLGESILMMERIGGVGWGSPPWRGWGPCR